MYNCILNMHILSLGSESESTLVVCAPNQSLNSATKFQKGVTRSQTSQSGHHLWQAAQVQVGSTIV